MKAEDIDGFGDLLAVAEQQASTDWDMGFVSELSDKYSEYGDNMFISDKQLAQLERIANGV